MCSSSRCAGSVRYGGQERGQRGHHLRGSLLGDEAAGVEKDHGLHNVLGWLHRVPGPCTGAFRPGNRKDGQGQLGLRALLVLRRVGAERAVARVAAAAPLGFFAVMTVLGLITPGYDSLSRFGSEPGLGPLGPIMIANFIALGLVLLALAVALASTVADRVSGWVAAGGIRLTGANRPLLAARVLTSRRLGGQPPPCAATASRETPGPH
jgi:hypothetical protein